MGSGEATIPRAWFTRSLMPMLLADLERRYVDANAAACLLLRAPRQELLRLRVDDLTVPRALPGLDSRWRDFVAAGTQAGTNTLVTPDGQELFVAYSATMYANDLAHIAMWHGRIQAVLATLDREELRWAGRRDGRRS